ncbi:MAG TPA: 2-C-methyl-D-erythritol 4-phosphate cytidylyltransferase [Streptosporangiaceae bacterium]|nr:2-C-methyl-D-erythritol 4-phosphate cytidylyltransferase [Streptosporangiaceae bacterium]
MRTVAVVLAGGSGQRFGTALPKQLLPLGGKPLIEHSVAAFDKAPDVDACLVVMAPGHAAEVGDLLARGGYEKVTEVIEGGVTRADSTRRAIAALGDTDCNVLLHDAARPLVDQRIIADCVRALRTHGAVGVAVASSDTIVVVEDGVMTSMPHRDSLRRCQTPQGFRLPVIRRAHELAVADPAFAALPPTDDCGVVLRYLPDVRVAVVDGSERNIKITYPGDLDVAELLLKR